MVPVALSEIDRSLLDRCLSRKPRAWEDFVDRFMGLVVHVINHTAQCRSINLSAADREDLAAEVFLAIVDNDMAVLRHFRGRSSLARIGCASTANGSSRSTAATAAWSAACTSAS